MDSQLSPTPANSNNVILFLNSSIKIDFLDKEYVVDMQTLQFHWNDNEDINFGYEGGGEW